MKKLLALLSLPLAIFAADDTYQYYPNGYNPVGTAAVSAESSTTSLETGTLRTAAAPSDLEARYRTWDESVGTDLNSTEFTSSMIILR